VDSVAVSASNPQVAYAAPKVISGSVGQAFGVYRSSDAGLTWAPANTGIETLAASALAIDPNDPQIVYASAGSKLWKTTNGGTSWVERPWDALGYQYPSAITIDPARPNIIYVSGQVIARSVDSGDTWQVISPAATASAAAWHAYALLVDPLRPNVIFAGLERFGAQQITIATDLALELNQSPATTLTRGQAVTLHYTAQNLGPYHATGAKVQFTIPAGLQNVTLQGGSGTCTVSATLASCTYATLRAGLSADITLTATPATEGALELVGTIASDQPDIDMANNPKTYSASVAVPADVSVTATGTSSAQVGTAVTHTLTVQNAGPGTASAVQVTHQVAAGLTLGSATASVGTCTASGATVTCNLGDLAPAATATVTVQANAATAGATVSNTTVSTSAPDVSTANNSASVSTTVTAPPPPANPPSGSEGGGGSLSYDWLLLLGAVLALRAMSRRDRRGFTSGKPGAPCERLAGCGFGSDLDRIRYP
jgi:uncharacterized repeat protein (TIGR01451 family)